MFVSKNKYDRLQSRLTAAEQVKDNYFEKAVKETKENYKLTGKIFELENNLRAKVAECERLQEELTAVKEKYTAAVQENFELVEKLAELKSELAESEAEGILLMEELSEMEGKVQEGADNDIKRDY